MATTVLSDFNRTLRDEPLYYIYKHRVYVTNNDVSPDEVTAWLRKRCAESRRGNRYRVVTYLNRDGHRYVDYVLMETCKDNDLIYMKMRWGWSEHKVARGERTPRKKLTTEQRIRRDAIVNNALQDFYATL